MPNPAQPFSHSLIPPVLAFVIACTGEITTPATEVGSPAGGARIGVPGTGGSPGIASPPSDRGPAADRGEPPPRLGEPPPRPCAAASRRVWKLTPAQYVRTMSALLGTAVDGQSDLEGTLPPVEGFSNDANPQVMSVLHVSHLLGLTRKAVGAAFMEPGKVFPCLADKLGDIACMRAFIDNFGTRAFRRPLTSADVDAYLASYQKNAAAQANDKALRTLATTMLMAPDFLFRTELGPVDTAAASVTLTPFERASSLSYFLTDGPPDAELFNAAKGGGLDTPDKVAAQARRLLASAGLARGAFKFLVETFGVREVVGATKETRDFPMWSPALADDMATASERFFEDVIWQGGAKLSSLLTANHTFANARMRFLYDVTDPAPINATTFQRLTLPPTHGGGVVVQPALMAVMVVDSDTGPVRRGRFVREKLLCQDVPDPPPAIAAMAVQPKPDGKTTQRERLAVHTQNPACSGCHQTMDPLGLAFENFDAIGRHRVTEAKKTIDASGTLTDVAPDNVRFSNGVDLLRILSTLPEASGCFARSALNYASGRTVTELDSCQVERVTKRLRDSGGNVIDLLVAIVSDEQFFVRRTSL